MILVGTVPGQQSNLLLTARWVAPMDRPIIADGAIAISGEVITDVGPLQRLRVSHCGPIHDCGDAVILPGLVNAHTHLELSGLALGPAPASLGDWLLEIVRQRSFDPALVGNAVHTGVRQCLRCGVTTVGDITRFPGASRAALANQSLRAVSFGEVQAMAQRRHLLEGRIAEAIQAADAPRVTIGISPHAPYTVEPQAYQRCLEVARAYRLPLATHLAESADEATFLAEHAGPFRRLWNELGWWSNDVPKFSGGPIRLAAGLGLLSHPTLLAHVNYCDDAEMELLAAGKASVIYCPRTHAYFGHPPHRWRDMLARGINVALGTDSCASSPDLNLLEDLRLVRQLAPELPGEVLWRMVTINAALALQQDRVIGSITPGKSADFAVFPLTSGTPNPLSDVLTPGRLPREVWIAGTQADLPKA